MWKVLLPAFHLEGICPMTGSGMSKGICSVCEQEHEFHLFRDWGDSLSSDLWLGACEACRNKARLKQCLNHMRNAVQMLSEPLATRLKEMVADIEKSGQATTELWVD